MQPCQCVLWLWAANPHSRNSQESCSITTAFQHTAVPMRFAAAGCTLNSALACAPQFFHIVKLSWRYNPALFFPASSPTSAPITSVFSIWIWSASRAPATASCAFCWHRGLHPRKHTHTRLSRLQRSLTASATFVVSMTWTFVRSSELCELNFLW